MIVIRDVVTGLSSAIGAAWCKRNRHESPPFIMDLSASRLPGVGFRAALCCSFLTITPLQTMATENPPPTAAWWGVRIAALCLGSPRDAHLRAAFLGGDRGRQPRGVPSHRSKCTS